MQGVKGAWTRVLLENVTPGDQYSKSSKTNQRNTTQHVEFKGQGGEG